MAVAEAVLRRLSDEREYPVAGHEAAVEAVEAVLAQGSGSLLLVGPRGPAKAAVVRRALASAGGDAGVVRLHGATRDTREALGAIGRALGVPAPRTCSELGALLMGGERDDSTAGGESHGERKRRLVVVVDAFEHFAPACPQLLYTLLDQCHAGAAPLCDDGGSEEAGGGEAGAMPTVLVALSARGDVLDGVEKRVRSRMAQAVCYVAQPGTFGAYLGAVRGALSGVGAPECDLGAWEGEVGAAVGDARVCAALRAQYDASREPADVFPALAVAVAMWSRGECPRVPEAVAEIAAGRDVFDECGGAAQSSALAACIVHGLGEQARARSVAERSSDGALSTAELCVLVCLRRVLFRRAPDAPPPSVDELWRECATNLALGARESDAEALAGRFTRASLLAAADALCARGLLASVSHRGARNDSARGGAQMDAGRGVAAVLPPACVPAIAERHAHAGAVYAALARVCAERGV